MVFLYWRWKRLTKSNNIPYSEKRWRGSSDELSEEINIGHSITKDEQEKHDKFVRDVKKLINDKERNKKNK